MLVLIKHQVHFTSLGKDRLDESNRTGNATFHSLGNDCTEAEVA